MYNIDYIYIYIYIYIAPDPGALAVSAEGALSGGAPGAAAPMGENRFMIYVIYYKSLCYITYSLSYKLHVLSSDANRGTLAPREVP